MMEGEKRDQKGDATATGLPSELWSPKTLRSMFIKATPGELTVPGVGKTNFEPKNLSGFEGFTREKEQDLRTDN